MKKILLAIFMFWFAVMPACAIVEEVMDGSKVYYSPSEKLWTKARGLFEDKITYTKHTSPGTGSYSEYYLDNQNEPEFVLSSNYEFVRNGKLIAVINKSLKFAEVINNNGKIQEKELNKKDVQKLFPYVKIIKLSSFRNREKTLRISKFPQQYLLLNDTKKDFHKYSFSPYNTDTPYIKAIFRINGKGIITFSHYGNDTYKIIVK